MHRANIDAEFFTPLSVAAPIKICSARTFMQQYAVNFSKPIARVRQ